MWPRRSLAFPNDVQYSSFIVVLVLCIRIETPSDPKA